MDLVVGEQNGVLTYIENTGTSTAPEFFFFLESSYSDSYLYDDDYVDDDEECSGETSNDPNSSPSGTTNHGKGKGWCHSGLDELMGCTVSPGNCWEMCEDAYGDGLVAIDWDDDGSCFCQNDCQCMVDVGNDGSYLITRDSAVAALPVECEPSPSNASNLFAGIDVSDFHGSSKPTFADLDNDGTRPPTRRRRCYPATRRPRATPSRRGPRRRARLLLRPWLWTNCARRSRSRNSCPLRPPPPSARPCRGRRPMVFRRGTSAACGPGTGAGRLGRPSK